MEARLHLRWFSSFREIILLDNIRFAVRQLRKNPGFATLAVLTLALGIGANTAMFTVIDSVLLRPLAYRDADRIVAITPGAPTENVVQTTSWLNYRDIREQASQFRYVAAYMREPFSSSRCA